MEEHYNDEEGRRQTSTDKNAAKAQEEVKEVLGLDIECAPSAHLGDEAAFLAKLDFTPQFASYLIKRPTQTVSELLRRGCVFPLRPAPSGPPAPPH